MAARHHGTPRDASRRNLFLVTSSAGGRVEAEPPRGFGFRVKRLALVCAMILTSINVWTGSPLAALWVGSRVQGDGPTALGSIGVVAATLLAISFGLIRLLGILGVAHDRLLGLPDKRRRQSPWLRSMRGEREETKDDTRHEMTTVETIVVATVIVAVIAFEVWFFFFSTSPIDQRTGR
jgi:hypothetical protein